MLVYREEGIMGFYRGLWIPLMTISFVRTCGDLPFCLYGLTLLQGPQASTIYSRTKENFRENNILCRDSIIDVSLTGGVSGAMSGALISFGSARMSRYTSPPTHY